MSATLTFPTSIIEQFVWTVADLFRHFLAADPDPTPDAGDGYPDDGGGAIWDDFSSSDPDDDFDYGDED
jgi:hypothetical protein